MNTLSMTVFAFKKSTPDRPTHGRADALLSAYYHSYNRLSELRQHRLRSISLTHGADDLDARGRSPMCSSRPSLGGEAGGRSPGFT